MVNTAYPAQAFDTPHALLQGFIDLLSEEFENPHQHYGTAICIVPELDDIVLEAKITDTLDMQIKDRDAVDLSNADARLTMPLATVERIFQDFATVDWRDPEIIGTVEMAGDMALVERLARSAERPTDWTLDRFADAEELHRDQGYRELSSIDTLYRPSQATVLDYIDAGRPAIIQGLGQEIFEQPWTLERLEALYGDAVVRVRSATDHVTMRQFCAELRAFMAANDKSFDRGLDIPYTEGAALPPEMHAQFGPLFFDKTELTIPQLWFGAVPTHEPTSSVHRDPHAGFLFQVIGRKRLELYSADQASMLYPRKAYNLYQPCWHTPNAPDFDRFPRARGLRKVTAVIEPGDLILQPAGWFHEVYALDSPNMSVSYFWAY